jgi:hypothetical protein
MNKLVSMMRFAARILTAILASPTDGAFVDRGGFGRAYRIRTTHGSLYFSWREVL